MWITSVNSSTPATQTITWTTFYERRRVTLNGFVACYLIWVRNFIITSFFLANRLQFMVPILESITEHDRSQTNPIHTRNKHYQSFKICFERNKDNQVRQDKGHEFGINHRMGILIIILSRTVEFFLKISLPFKVGFFQFNNFEQENVQQKGCCKISVNKKRSVEKLSNNKSREKGQDPNRYPQPKETVIFNKDNVHFVPALFAKTIPSLNYAIKSKTLLFTKYFLLLPIGLTASSLIISGNIKTSKAKLLSHSLYPHLYPQILGTTERFY